MGKGHRKIAQVKFKKTDKEIAEAKIEGFELSSDWQYSPLMTVKQAVIYYNELIDMGYDAQWGKLNQGGQIERVSNMKQMNTQQKVEHLAKLAIGEDCKIIRAGMQEYRIVFEENSELPFLSNAEVTISLQVDTWTMKSRFKICINLLEVIICDKPTMHWFKDFWKFLENQSHIDKQQFLDDRIEIANSFFGGAL